MTFQEKQRRKKEGMWATIAAVNLVNLQQTLQYVSVSSYSDLRQYGSFIDCYRDIRRGPVGGTTHN